MIYWQEDNYVLVEMSYINAPIQLYSSSLIYKWQVHTSISASQLLIISNFNEYVKLKEPVVYFSSIYCQLWVITDLKLLK
jgi:hypothetical protein